MTTDPQPQVDPEQTDSPFTPHVPFTEQLLALGTAHILQHDLLASPGLAARGSPAELAAAIRTALSLTRWAMDLQEQLEGMPIHRGRAFAAVQARLRQLAMLANDSGEAIMNAGTVLAPTRSLASPEDLSASWVMEARSVARSALAAGRDFVAFGAQDCLAAAETYAGEMRKRGSFAPARPVSLSPVQNAGLRAVALGHVAVSDDRTVRMHGGSRTVAIATIRSLEARGLTTRVASPHQWFWSRCIPTADGHRALTATLALPAASVRVSAPTSGPAQRVPGSTR
ncbi:hypothetical protein ACWGI1_00300 [Streptomyces sp. NPDC054835]|uniref:hypothetical protein n=1 Tax=Streptomyces exfoliatus TaxID=1905 RepID=UPI0004649EC1|nr:hypothetical protein [Streptomyces exfoliatus]